MKYFKNFDYIFFFMIAALLIMGLLSIFSATHGMIEKMRNAEIYFVKQLAWVVISLLGFLLIMKINYEKYRDYYPVFYIIGVFLLVSVLFAGVVVRNSKSWLNIGGFILQPSELMKIFFIMALAGFLESYQNRIRSAKAILIPLFLAAVPVALILKQPDFGTAITFFPVLLGMLFVAGARVIYLMTFVLIGVFSVGSTLYTGYINLQPHILKHSAFLSYIYRVVTDTKTRLIFIAAAAAILLAGYFIMRLVGIRGKGLAVSVLILTIFIGLNLGSYADSYLKPYQKKRLITFMSPETDPLGSGYNIIQSIIAVGSGGIVGKGFLHGTQSRLGFLPEQRTDFVFAVLGEEWGFAGSMFTLAIYLLIILRIIKTGYSSRTLFGAYFCTGVAVLLSFHLIINVGMVIGIMPITGLPLPFLSYGGSSMLSFVTALAVVFNINSQRYIF